MASPVDFLSLFGGGLKGISDLFGDDKSVTGNSSSTGRSTKQTELTPEAQMEMIRKMMEDPQMGVQSIMAPQQGAGTFGGSNQALMMSNLLARVAGQAALASAKTTETVDSQTSSGTTTKERKPIERGIKNIGKLFKKIF